MSDLLSTIKQIRARGGHVIASDDSLIIGAGHPDIARQWPDILQNLGYERRNGRSYSHPSAELPPIKLGNSIAAKPPYTTMHISTRHYVNGDWTTHPAAGLLEETLILIESSYTNNVNNHPNPAEDRARPARFEGPDRRSPKRRHTP